MELELGTIPQAPLAMNEGDCTFTFEGRDFTSGGAYIWPCKDGRYHGMVYVHEVEVVKGVTQRTVTTWHGNFIARIDRLTDYRGSFCRHMRRMTFTLKGVKFVGDYCPDWAQMVRVHSTKKFDFAALDGLVGPGAKDDAPLDNGTPRD